MDERILVVDDEEVVLMAVRKTLKKDAYRIDTATNAEQALASLAETTYDLVITDLMMPGINGLDLLKRISETGAKTPTIMITGYPTIQTALKAKRLGAHEYVTKPFTRQELRSSVVRALRESGKRRVLEEPVPTDPAPGSEDREQIYTIPYHSWAAIESTGTVRIGMADAFVQLIEDISTLHLPKKDEFLEQGRQCANIGEKSGIEHTLHCPVGGRVLEINQRVLDDPALAGKDPSGTGWLFRLKPTNLERDLRYLAPK